MYTGKTLFAQLMYFLPWTTFARIVDRYDGNHRVRTLACTEHFRVLAFAHQEVLWDVGERREDANLGRRERVRFGGHRQKAPGLGCLALHIATGSFRHLV